MKKSRMEKRQEWYLRKLRRHGFVLSLYGKVLNSPIIKRHPRLFSGLTARMMVMIARHRAAPAWVAPSYGFSEEEVWNYLSSKLNVEGL